MLVYIRPLGNNLAYVTPISGPVDPGYGVGGGGHPDQGLPGWPGHPDQGLPGGPGHVAPPIFHPGHPDHGLPSRPPHVGGRPPGSGNPNFPDHSLPPGPPPHVGQGTTIVLVRDPAGVWHYATLPPGTPPPVVVPTPPMAPTPEPKK